jgi:hypothetical protein
VARIEVDRTLEAPIEHVFELISDHGAYSTNFRGITSSEVITAGEPAPNGLGAVRSIASGPVRFEEEITSFEPPTRMDYLIREVNAPIVHHGGSIRLEDLDGRTRVLWTSEYDSTLKLGSGAYEAVATRILAAGFASVLKRIEALHPAGAASRSHE